MNKPKGTNPYLPLYNLSVKDPVFRKNRITGKSEYCDMQKGIV